MLYLQICLINLIILLCLSEAVEFEDDDSIIIEAAEEPLKSDSRQGRQFIGQFGFHAWPVQMISSHYPIFQVQPKPGICYTSKGDEGECTSLRQCYPALRTIGENNAFVNPGLADDLKSTSGSCEGIMPYMRYFRNELVPHQTSNSICCSSQPSQEPTRLLPKMTSTTTSSSRNFYRPPFFGHRPPADTTTPPLSFVPSNCGVGHITGGSEAEPSNKYPWIVAILNGQKQICGGSLFSSHHVLTASHCVSHMNQFDVAKIRVLLGAHNIYHVSSGTIVKKVSRLIKHRFFNHRTLVNLQTRGLAEFRAYELGKVLARSSHNDIAILKLDSAVSFTDRIRPICLANEVNNRYENQIATVAGWGSVGEHSSQPHSLREVAINVWTNDQCRNKYGLLAPGGITEHMLCAGHNDRDACRGDSGGPLMIQSDSVFKQIGIVSWGIGCGRFPGVYTRITHFLDWIEKNRK